MRLERLSIMNLCLLIGAGALFSMLAVTAAFYALTENTLMLFDGIALTVCALVWLFLLVQAFGRRLSVFTGDLCRMLDNMISGNEEPKQGNDIGIGLYLAREIITLQSGYIKVTSKVHKGSTSSVFLPGRS